MGSVAAAFTLKKGHPFIFIGFGAVFPIFIIVLSLFGSGELKKKVGKIYRLVNLDRCKINLL